MKDGPPRKGTVTMSSLRERCRSAGDVLRRTM